MADDRHDSSPSSNGHDAGETPWPASSSKVVETALVIAAEGWPVFPCKTDKKPIFKGGFKNASTDPAVIRDAFKHPQAELIGVPTGLKSGIDVLDLDPRHDSDAWKQANPHLLPETRVHMTMHGGEHYLFRHAAGVRNSQSLIAPGLDVRGEGGYVIFPPSAGYCVISDAGTADWPPELTALGAYRRRYQAEVLDRLDQCQVGRSWAGAISRFGLLRAGWRRTLVPSRSGGVLAG